MSNLTALQPKLVTAAFVSSTCYAVVWCEQTGKFFVHKDEVVLLRTRDEADARYFYDRCLLVAADLN